jgi:hypothetical protein
MALITRYETITLQEVAEALEFTEYIQDAHRHLTGFGYQSSCKLCRAVPKKTVYHSWGSHKTANCKYCVYPGDSGGCLDNDTFDAIARATEPDDLLLAYRNRAKYMRTLVE